MLSSEARPKAGHDINSVTIIRLNPNRSENLDKRKGN